ncbi:hypothetical protein GZH46_01430, partial [Fragariocoptes setiger]
CAVDKAHKLGREEALRGTGNDSGLLAAFCRVPKTSYWVQQVGYSKRQEFFSLFDSHNLVACYTVTAIPAATETETADRDQDRSWSLCFRLKPKLSLRNVVVVVGCWLAGWLAVGDNNKTSVAQTLMGSCRQRLFLHSFVSLPPLPVPVSLCRRTDVALTTACASQRNSQYMGAVGVATGTIGSSIGSANSVNSVNSAREKQRKRHQELYVKTTSVTSHVITRTLMESCSTTTGYMMRSVMRKSYVNPSLPTDDKCTCPPATVGSSVTTRALSALIRTFLDPSHSDSSRHASFVFYGHHNVATG